MCIKSKRRRYQTSEPKSTSWRTNLSTQLRSLRAMYFNPCMDVLFKKSSNKVFIFSLLPFFMVDYAAPVERTKLVCSWSNQDLQVKKRWTKPRKGFWATSITKRKAIDAKQYLQGVYTLSQYFFAWCSCSHITKSDIHSKLHLRTLDLSKQVRQFEKMMHLTNQWVC